MQFGGGWTWVILGAATAILPCYYRYRYRYAGLPQSFKRGEIGIVIGWVPGETNPQQVAAYARELRALAEKCPRLSDIVKVRMLSRPLPVDSEEQREEAVRWGHWLHATFVIRVNAVEGVQEPWLSVVDQPHFSKVELPLQKFPTAKLANLDELPLPNNLLLLARCALALAFYSDSSFTQSNEQLEFVLSSPNLPEAAPTRADLECLLGNGLLSTDRVDEGIAEYRKSIALNPDIDAAHFNLGMAFHLKGQLDVAIAEYRKAIALNPSNEEAHLNLGVALAKNGQLDQAVDEQWKAVSLKPNDENAYVDLGLALDENGHHDEAIAEYRKAIALNPNLEEAHLNLGASLHGNGQLDEAIAEYRKAIAAGEKVSGTFSRESLETRVSPRIR